MHTRVRIRWQPVHGVLLLDKPRGLTSQDALQAARRVLQAAKAGHTGTLDPLADGLLPLCFGGATKFAQIHLDADKAYRAVVQLGVVTTTDDGEGETVRAQPVPPVSPELLRPVLARFVGAIQQVPPLYSALKREGRPLYAYARAGQVLDVPARPVRVDAIDIVAIDGDRLTLDVRCGKGTYIRSLARDIGEALGCGAHLAALTRTASGPFTLAQAHPLDALRTMEPEQARELLLPVDTLVQDLPRVDLDSSQSAAIMHGRGVQFPSAPAGGLLRLYAHADAQRDVFLGLAREDAGTLRPQRLLSNEELQTQSQST